MGQDTLLPTQGNMEQEGPGPLLCPYPVPTAEVTAETAQSK